VQGVIGAGDFRLNRAEVERIEEALKQQVAA
jgi:hypothetical protein